MERGIHPHNISLPYGVTACSWRFHHKLRCRLGWRKKHVLQLRLAWRKACIATSFGLVDTTKKRWDPPYVIFRCCRVEPPALADSTINCDVDWLGEKACIAASLGLVDTTKKRWDPPYVIFRCRRVEPPALGDSTIICDVDWAGEKNMFCSFVWLGEKACIAASLGLVDTTKKRWDPPYE